MSRTQKLKSCPLCGNKAELRRCWGNNEYFAHCTNPDCKACYIPVWDSYSTKEESIESWNKMTEDEIAKYIAEYESSKDINDDELPDH